MKLTFIPTVHHRYVRQNINFIYKLEGKVRNNFKKLPINKISIPICKKPLAIQIKPRFFMFLQNQKKMDPNINNKIKFIIILNF